MKLFLFILAIFFSNSIKAQYQNSFTIIDSRNGLKSDFVNSISEDSENYIWISTDNGLTRYNGTEFKTFSTEDGLNSNEISSSVVDSKKRLWVSNYYYGINYIKDNKVYLLKNAKILGLSFRFEKNDTIYFSSKSTGKTYFLNKENSLKEYKIKNKNIALLFYNKLNDIYFAYDSLSDKYYLINHQKDFIPSFLTEDHYNKFTLYNTNLFYKHSFFDSVKKSNTYNKKRVHRSEINNFINDLKKIIPLYKKEDLLNTNNDQNIFSLFQKTKSHQFIYKRVSEFLKTNGIDFKSIFIDSNKNFWIIDHKNKLYYIRYSSLQIVNKFNSDLFNSDDVFIKKHILIDHNLFFITNNNLFGYVNLNNYKTKIIHKFDHTVYNIFYLDNTICIPSEKGIYHLKIKKNQTVHLSDLKYKKTKNAIYHNHDLYYIDKNIIKSEKGDFIKFSSSEMELEDFTANEDMIAVYNDEMIGIYNFKTKKKRTIFSIEHANYLKKIDHEIIVSTGNKDVYFLDDNLKIVQQLKLKDNGYYIGYKSGKLFLATINNITVYYKKKNKWLFLNRINFKEGVMRGKVLDFIFLKEKIIVLTNNGISEIKDSYINKIASGSININNFSINGTSIIDKKHKIFEQGNINIAITTSLKTFDNKDNFNIFYRLIKNGDYSNTSWKPLTYKTVLFDNLPAGEYNFEVFSTTIRQSNIKSFDKISFTIKPYFWETNLFFTTVVLLYILLFIFSLRFFRKKITKNNRLKLELITLELKSLKNQMKPHFLFNALNNLQSILFIKGPEETNKYIIKFSKLLRSTLEVTRNNTISLEEEINYINTYLDFEQIKGNHELFITYAINKGIKLKEIEIPVMVIQTIVENAIIHGLTPSKKRKELLIKIQQRINQIQIIIEDNGVGRSHRKENPHENHKSYGSLIIEERFKILSKLNKTKYQIEIIDLFTDNIASGTRVIITLPVKYIEL